MLPAFYASHLRYQRGTSNLIPDSELILRAIRRSSAMKNSPTTPRTSDSELAVRIALVREMTEAARAGVISWDVRDRRLRASFRVEDFSRAFDTRRPCHGPYG